MPVSFEPGRFVIVDHYASVDWLEGNIFGGFRNTPEVAFSVPRYIAMEAFWIGGEQSMENELAPGLPPQPTGYVVDHLGQGIMHGDTGFDVGRFVEE